jgi:KTSC domain
MSTPAVTPNASEPLNPLVGKIRAAHPGAYDDMDDAALTKAVLAKYPQYEDLARPASPMPGSPSTQKVEYDPGAPSDPTSPTSGLPGSSPNPQPATEGMTHAAELGIGAAAGGVYGPGIARAAAPYALPALGSYAISKARELPVIGPVLKHIPFAEMIPWMAAGRGKVGEAEPAPEAAPEVTPEGAPEAAPALKAPPETPAIGEPAVASPPVASVEAPSAPPAKIAPPNPARIGDLLNEGLGGKIPEGHTPTGSSSALQSYKYDPATREFEAVTKSGQHYVYGDVPPEAADKFMSAPSKGKAWTELRATPGVTQVAKVVNGQRVGTQPPVAIRSASPDDLTPILQQSLEAAKKARATRIAKPN